MTQDHDQIRQKRLHLTAYLLCLEDFDVATTPDIDLGEVRFEVDLSETGWSLERLAAVAVRFGWPELTVGELISTALWLERVAPTRRADLRQIAPRLRRTGGPKGC